MLKKFLSDAVQTVSSVKSATPQNTTKNQHLKLHRIASEPYSIQAKRMQDIHRTLSDSTHCSAYSREDRSDLSDCSGGQRETAHKKVLPRRSSLRKRDSSKVRHYGNNIDDSDQSRESGGAKEKKKTVTWIDDKIPGRSISEFHLITPRSFASARHEMRSDSFSNQTRTSTSLSLRANQQLQYYYYHQQASRSPRACQSCLGSLRSFWWGL
jgi:hypothetical protein